MKILFKTTAADLAAAKLETILRAYTAKIEGTAYTFDKLMPLFRKMSVAYDSGAIGASIYNVWLDMPVQIQQITDGTNPVTFEELSPANEILYKGFMDTVVNEMQAGKGYIVPFTADAVTASNPMIQTFDCAGSGLATAKDDRVSSGYYAYVATKTEQNRNGQSFTGLTYDIIPAVAQQMAVVKSGKAQPLQTLLLRK